MNKELSKAVIVSSKLWNRFLRLKTEKLNCLCKKTQLLRQYVTSKKGDYYDKLNMSSITDDKLFGKIYAHYLPTKNYIKAL